MSRDAPKAAKRGRPIRGKTLAKAMSIRLADEDKALLEDIAHVYGVSLATAVALSVRNAWKTITPDQRKALATLKKTMALTRD